jgi:hypothetical protein
MEGLHSGLSASNRFSNNKQLSSTFSNLLFGCSLAFASHQFIRSRGPD